MTIQQAIQKAIEGGYSLRGFTISEYVRKQLPTTMLDPQFWKCLGKAMGWKLSEKRLGKFGKDEWLRRWHRLIDHLASGGTVEDYFAKL